MVELSNCISPKFFFYLQSLLSRVFWWTLSEHKMNIHRKTQKQVTLLGHPALFHGYVFSWFYTAYNCIFFCHWNCFLYLIEAGFFLAVLTALCKLPSEGVWELLKRALKSFSLSCFLSLPLSLSSLLHFFFFSLCSGNQFPQGRKSWKLNSCPPWIQLTGRKSPNRSNLIRLEEAGKTTFKLGASLKEAFINNVHVHPFTARSAPPCLLLRLMWYQSWEKQCSYQLPPIKKKKADE